MRRVLALLLLLTLSSFAGAAWKAFRLHREIQALEAALEAQRRYNREMERALSEATTPQAIESRARATLGLVRPGEEVVELATPVPPDDPYRVPKR